MKRHLKFFVIIIKDTFFYITLCTGLDVIVKYNSDLHAVMIYHRAS